MPGSGLRRAKSPWFSFSSPNSEENGKETNLSLRINNNCYIRISDAEDGIPSDTSDYAFEIATGPSAIVVCPDGSGDYETIQEAIDAAPDYAVIELCDATFEGAGNRDIDFLGKPITVRSQSGDPMTCVVAANGTPEDPRRAFRFASREGPETTVSGITIAGGLLAPGC